MKDVFITIIVSIISFIVVGLFGAESIGADWIVTLTFSGITTNVALLVAQVVAYIVGLIIIGVIKALMVKAEIDSAGDIALVLSYLFLIIIIVASFFYIPNLVHYLSANLEWFPIFTDKQAIAYTILYALGLIVVALGKD